MQKNIFIPMVSTLHLITKCSDKYQIFGIILFIYFAVTVEALKLLCNLIFNSAKVQEILPKTLCLQCLIERMKKYNDHIPYEVTLFDTRIVFLITALNVTTRHVVKTELNGDECLIKMLENISNQYEQDKSHDIKEDNATLLCEILKALFNLYINSDDMAEEEKNKSLVLILRKLLLSECEKEDDLQRYLLPFTLPYMYIILCCYTIFIFQQHRKSINCNTILLLFSNDTS